MFLSAALCFVQAIYGAVGIAQYPLWLDETYSAIMAQKSLPDMLEAMRFDAGPPLYYTLLHGFGFMTGFSEAALRGLSLLFSLCVTWIIFRFCARHLNRETALCAALLWIFSPLSLQYAQEARNYTLFAALALAWLFFMIRFAVMDIRRDLLLSGALLLALVYTHNFGWLLLPLSWITMLWFPRRRRHLVALAITQAAVILLYSPWISTLMHQFALSEMTIGWVAKAWTPWALVWSLSTFTPGGKPFVILDLPVLPLWGRLLVYLAFAALIFRSVWQALRLRQTFLFALYSFFVMVLLLPYGFSLLLRPVYLPGRTDFFVFPLFCILIGHAIQSLPRHASRWTILATILLLMLSLNLARLFQTPPYQERDVILYLQNHIQPQDVILCTGLTLPMAEYYLKDRVAAVVSYPPDMAMHLAHFNEEWYMQHLDIAEAVRNSLQSALDHARPPATIWVIDSARLINRPLRDAMQRNPRLKPGDTIQTPSMGLRRLDEPLFLLRYPYEPTS